MPHDSTMFLFPSADVWVADWDGAERETRRDSLGEYEVYTVTVTRREDAPRPEPPEGFDKVVSNGRKVWTLRHISTGNAVVMLRVEATQWLARGTDADGRRISRRVTEEIPFKAEGKRRYTYHFAAQVGRQMAGYGTTVRKCAQFCHVAPALIKQIDLERLRALAGDLRPTHHSRYIAVDEFKIASPRRFCTIIIDAETGELLFLRKGKTKQQVLKFFEWAGEDFMSHVEAVAMDMNANYSAAFRERYPGIRVVWDCFHLMLNYNDKVVNGARRTLARSLLKSARELEEKGDAEGAEVLMAERRLLFGTRHIMLANRTTLEAMDRRNAELNKEAKELAVAEGRDPKGVGNRRTDAVERLDAVVRASDRINSIVKAREELQAALALRNAAEMRRALEEWVGKWGQARILQLTRYCKLVTNRMDGIVARAEHGISSGILEGTNALVKAMLRQSFGMRDMDYFGLKLWEKTHLPNGTRRPETGDDGRPKRKYVRRSPHNRRRARQTIYMTDKELERDGRGTKATEAA